MSLQNSKDKVIGIERDEYLDKYLDILVRQSENNTNCIIKMLPNLPETVSKEIEDQLKAVDKRFPLPNLPAVSEMLAKLYLKDLKNRLHLISTLLHSCYTLIASAKHFPITNLNVDVNDDLVIREGGIGIKSKVKDIVIPADENQFPPTMSTTCVTTLYNGDTIFYSSKPIVLIVPTSSMIHKSIDDNVSGVNSNNDIVI